MPDNFRQFRVFLQVLLNMFRAAKVIVGLLMTGFGALAGSPGQNGAFVNFLQTSFAQNDAVRAGVIGDFGHFIWHQMRDLTLLGMIAGTSVGLWVALTARSGFIPHRSATIRRNSHVMFGACMVIAVSWFVAQYLRKGGYWTLPSLIAHGLSPTTGYVWLILAVGLSLSLLLCILTFAGMVFILSPIAVRVVAAPPFMSRIFRLAPL